MLKTSPFGMLLGAVLCTILTIILWETYWSPVVDFVFDHLSTALGFERALMVAEIFPFIVSASLAGLLIYGVYFLGMSDRTSAAKLEMINAPVRSETLSEKATDDFSNVSIRGQSDTELVPKKLEEDASLVIKAAPQITKGAKIDKLFVAGSYYVAVLDDGTAIGFHKDRYKRFLSLDEYRKIVKDIQTVYDDKTDEADYLKFRFDARQRSRSGERVYRRRLV